MSLLDFLHGSVKCRIHVLDDTHPDEKFLIERRVSRSVYQRYAVNGELFASISDRIHPKFEPGFELGERVYAFMPQHLWQNLANEYKSTRNLNLEQMLEHMFDTTDRFAKGTEHEDRSRPKEELEAVSQYSEAAAHGSADAQYKLGQMYDDGEGVQQDHEEAAKWLRKAADQGHAAALNRLAFMYFLGLGVPAVDHAECVKLLRKAADQGDVFAQNELGGVYETGLCGAVDEAEAEKWYRMAADQGFTLAQQGLASLKNKQKF